MLAMGTVGKAPAEKKAVSREGAMTILKAFDDGTVWLTVCVDGTWVKVAPCNKRMQWYERQMRADGVYLEFVSYSMWQPAGKSPVALEKPSTGYRVMNQ